MLRRLTRCRNDIYDQIGITSKLHPSLFYVGAGNIELICGNPRDVLEPLNDPYIVLDGIAEDVDDDLCVVFLQQGKFVLDEGSYSHILQAYGVQHPRWGLTEPRSRSTLDGLQGNAFGDEAAQVAQVNQMSEFQAITKGAAGSDDGISKAQSANLHLEVNAFQGIHVGDEDSTKPRELPKNTGRAVELFGGGFMESFREDTSIARGQRDAAKRGERGRNIRGRDRGKVFPWLNSVSQQE